MGYSELKEEVLLLPELQTQSCPGQTPEFNKMWFYTFGAQTLAHNNLKRCNASSASSTSLHDSDGGICCQALKIQLFADADSELL